MKPKTRQEIAEEFNISRTTFYRLLKREGIELPGGLLYAKEQEIVYRKLGVMKEVLGEGILGVKQTETN